MLDHQLRRQIDTLHPVYYEPFIL